MDSGGHLFLEEGVENAERKRKERNELKRDYEKRKIYFDVLNQMPT